MPVAPSRPPIGISLLLALMSQLTEWSLFLSSQSNRRVLSVFIGRGAVMPSFKIGDRVERISVLAPTWMKVGIVTRVIPNKHGIDWATQYEVVFGEMKETFYQTELRLVSS